MAERLNFREAVARAGVSRQRLNEAIKSGRLPAVRGGGPGKPTYIDIEDLQAWCAREGLAMPVESLERSARLRPEDLTLFAEHFRHIGTALERLEDLVGRILERLERSSDPASAQALLQALESIKASAPIERSEPSREEIIARMCRARDAEGKSFQTIANELNAEGIPTFSGKGVWGKGTVERFYKGRST
jgi:Recombinase